MTKPRVLSFLGGGERVLIAAYPAWASQFARAGGVSSPLSPPCGGRSPTHATCWRPFYSWFTESVETPDLKEAKALLDDLT